MTRKGLNLPKMGIPLDIFASCVSPQIGVALLYVAMAMVKKEGLCPTAIKDLEVHNMIDETNVHLFGKFEDLIHQAVDLANHLQVFQAELRQLEADVAHTLQGGPGCRQRLTGSGSRW